MFSETDFGRNSSVWSILRPRWNITDWGERWTRHPSVLIEKMKRFRLEGSHTKHLRMVGHILKINWHPTSEIKHGLIRCLINNEKANITFEGHFTPNDFKDPKQEREFRTILHDIDRMDCLPKRSSGPSKVFLTGKSLERIAFPKERWYAIRPGGRWLGT